MRLFAVRIIEDQQPVGFFFVKHLARLGDVVDAVTDPGICEYKEISSVTGIVWEGRENWKMGVRDEAIANEDIDEYELAEKRHKLTRRGMQLDGSFSYALTELIDGDHDIDGWKPLVWDFYGHAKPATASAKGMIYEAAE